MILCLFEPVVNGQRLLVVVQEHFGSQLGRVGCLCVLCESGCPARIATGHSRVSFFFLEAPESSTRPPAPFPCFVFALSLTTRRGDQVRSRRLQIPGGGNSHVVVVHCCDSRSWAFGARMPPIKVPLGRGRPQHFLASRPPTPSGREHWRGGSNTPEMPRTAPHRDLALRVWAVDVSGWLETASDKGTLAGLADSFFGGTHEDVHRVTKYVRAIDRTSEWAAHWAQHMGGGM